MTTATPSTADVRRNVLSLIDSFDAHDVDKILAHFTTGVVWEDPNLAQPAVGREEARAVVEAQLTAFSDLTFSRKSLHVFVDADGKSGVSTWEWTGTMTGPVDPPGYAPTGKRVTVRGSCFYEFDKGLISKHVVIYDRLGLMQQAGLMPSDESVQVKAMAGAQRLLRVAAQRLPSKH